MTQNITTQTFIDKSNEKHGHRYDYSKTEYLKSNVYVTIGCGVHGMFEQLPRNHLRGAGCPQCAADARNEKGADVGTVKKKQVESSRFFPPGTMMALPFWGPVPE